MSSSINWQSTRLANTNCQVIGPDSNIVDVLIEIKKGKANNSAIFLIGSWDNWIGKIRMKYSHFTNSFLAVLSLPISSKINEYEFLFTNGDPRDFGYHVNKYRNRSPSKTLKKGRVNFVKLNFTTQNGNRNSTSIENKDLLGKISMVDNSMVKLIKRVKTDVKRQNFLGQTMKKIKQKYSKIRDKFSSQLHINPQQMKALVDVAIRAHAYAIILFLLYDWAKLEKESAALKRSKNAVTIRVEFMNKLQQFVITKEEAIHQFKRTFCHPLLSECRRQIGLGEESMEIRKLKTFLKRWEDEKRPKKEDKIDEKKMKKEQQVEKKALTEILITQQRRKKMNYKKKEIIRRNNVDWGFLRQKGLRKKTYERRMKSRIMEKNKFNKKKATTEMIMEGWNEKWWIENRNKGQKEANRKAMELANKQKLMNEVNEKMKEEKHHRICLKEGSSEILQLKTFLDANFCA